MESKPFLSIIIPSYNELENIRKGVLDSVLAYLNEQTYVWELILSDDGSTDGTSRLLDQFASKDTRIKVLHNLHAGKAATVTAGMLHATGSWRLFTDFDQSTPLSEVEKLLEYTKKGSQVVIGSREIIGAKRDQEPWYRHLMGRVFNWLVQILAVPGILDTQCGFKLFSQQAVTQLFPKLYVYGSQAKWKDAFTGAFDVELLFLAYQMNIPIKEVPIVWKHAHTKRVNPIKDSLRMFRDIVRIRIATWQGAYQ